MRAGYRITGHGHQRHVAGVDQRGRQHGQGRLRPDAVVDFGLRIQIDAEVQQGAIRKVGQGLALGPLDLLEPVDLRPLAVLGTPNSLGKQRLKIGIADGPLVACGNSGRASACGHLPAQKPARRWLQSKGSQAAQAIAICPRSQRAFNSSIAQHV
jgi:hypothetical protein